MTWLTDYLYPFAGILWNFFTFIGEVAFLPLYDVISGNAVVSVSNPFGYDSWTVDINPNFEIVEDILRWLLDTLNVPNMPFFAGFLFVFAICWAVLLFAKLILGIFT